MEVRFILSKNVQENKSYYLAKNNHYYQYVSGYKTWIEAYNEAKNMTYMGQTGYLATITSLSEEEIIYESIGQGSIGWLGGTRLLPKDFSGSDSLSDNRNDSLLSYETDLGMYYSDFRTSNKADFWYWACGPERGEAFYSKATKQENATIGYSNWNTVNEPNDQEGEDALTTLALDTGESNSGSSILKDKKYSWNDIAYNRIERKGNSDSYVAKGYIVEFGAGKNSFEPEGTTDDTNITSTTEIVASAFLPVGNTYSITGDADVLTVMKGKNKFVNISANTPNTYYTGKPYDKLSLSVAKIDQDANPIETKDGNIVTSYLLDNNNDDEDEVKTDDKTAYVSYQYTSTDGKGYNSTIAPTEIGSYKVKIITNIGTSRSSIEKEFKILTSPVFIPDGFGKEEIPANITQSDIDKVRAAGADRIDTYINISKAFYQKADNVVVANAWNFPDALSASVLANILKAPILLNGQKTLDTRVNAEITRLGAKDAVVVGGENSLAKAVQNSLNGFDKNGTQRISGDNRYATSAKIAEEIFKATKKSDTVVIASGENFADSLSAAGFASKNGYPILLVKKNTVPSEITNVLKKYNVKNTIIVGGTGSVSDQVAKEIKSIAPNQERIAGKDRYDTSVQVAKLKMADTDKAFIASGKNFADALVVGAIAGANNQSVILVSDKGANQSAKDYIKSNIKKINVIGGEDTVPTSTVMNLLK